MLFPALFKALLFILDILSCNTIFESLILAHHIFLYSHWSVGNFTDRITTQRGKSTKKIVETDNRASQTTKLGSSTDRITTQRGVSTKKRVATENRASQTTKLVIIVIMSVILLASVSVLIRLKCKINFRKVHVTKTAPAEERLSAHDVKPGRVTKRNSKLHSSAITAVGEQIQAQTKGIQQKVINKRPKGSSVKDTLAKGHSSFGSRVTFCT